MLPWIKIYEVENQNATVYHNCKAVYYDYLLVKQSGNIANQYNKQIALFPSFKGRPVKDTKGKKWISSLKGNQGEKKNQQNKTPTQGWWVVFLS